MITTNFGDIMNEKDPYQLRTNLLIIGLLILILLLAIDIFLRISPGFFGTSGRDEYIVSAVGYHHQFPDSSWYYIYTVFENNGDVYQVWWDGKDWYKKKVTNYRNEETSQQK